jgi:hypothetical protein
MHSWHVPNNKRRRPELDIHSPFMSICWSGKRRQLNWQTKLAKTHWKLLVKLYSKVLEMVTINYDLKLEYEARMLERKGSKWEESSQKNQPSIHSLLTARSETNAEEIRRAEVRWRLKSEKDERMRREECACLVRVKKGFL